MQQDAGLMAVLGLARQGRFAQAADAAEAALAHGRRDAPMLALAGAIALQLGDWPRAVEHLAAALALAPEDPVVRRNLAQAYHQVGDYAALLPLAQAPHGERDASLQLAGLAGHAAQSLGLHEQALPHYRLILARQPQDWACWNNLGNSLRALGRVAEAVDALRRALDLAPDARPIRLNLAHALIDTAAYDEAEALLARMIAQDGQDPHPHFARYSLLLAQGREEEAFLAVSQAAALAPDRADIAKALGQHGLRLGHFAQAQAALERAMDLQGDDEVVVALASALERRNQERALPALRLRAEAAGASPAGVSPAVLCFIDALLARRAGDHATALAALEGAQPVMAQDQWHALRGQALDRLGRYDEAFASFAAMNALQSAAPNQPRIRAAAYRQALLNARDRVDAAWLARWQEVDQKPTRPAPVFLLGFPRSGTTLLDTMLMADPRVLVLEEEPFIGDLDAALGGIEALPDLSPDQITQARESYFARIAAGGPLSDDTLVIDKHPMHLAKLPTILRLFPDARFILALRHPCDAVLSCFMTSFRPNDAMANFLDLGDAAALYDIAFGLWEQLRALLPMAVSTIRYEDLVADPQAQLRPLFATLGLDWPEQGIDHRAAARQRGTVTTASYAQVTEPLYRRAAGRWLAYAADLAPVLPVLAPWIARYGYAPGD
ncbi:sulfotransferase family protein [Novosphingobium umbonatum]|uniref:Sulfotransferase family protein n=1 Tax=Novosphingobium umbonatum TaxID=1908524 RepID=A0A437N026_9SPHN|nr:tetratricopeptide repeat-containing sulfotransferase family protein [Novosphingobium umbonatum]RVU03249.1 sulfotransferase family protein [Novosphingobium umbonatum]